ncbi:hypothetical protein ABC766_12200 [Methylobacterium fujisawaense]|uniref:hypothetical protein n=1 Tax=Methylobacterium fujisawaense TaxID=107400 RepID=UPI0031F4FA3A
MRRAHAALILAEPRIVAADHHPPPVAAALARAKASCGSEAATHEPDVITRRAVKRSAMADVVLRLSAVPCGDDAVSESGTAGCEMRVSASKKDEFVEAVDPIAFWNGSTDSRIR